MFRSCCCFRLFIFLAFLLLLLLLLILAAALTDSQLLMLHNICCCCCRCCHLLLSSPRRSACRLCRTCEHEHPLNHHQRAAASTHSAVSQLCCPCTDWKSFKLPQLCKCGFLCCAGNAYKFTVYSGLVLPRLPWRC